MNTPTLSIVIPAYNEEKRIKNTLKIVQEFLLKKEYSYEVIVVSDGSPDQTSHMVTEVMKDFPQLSLVDNKKNMGKGYAVYCGMMKAQGTFRLFMDADHSVDISYCDVFMDEIKNNATDVAIASIAADGSKAREGNGGHRRALGSLSNILVRTLVLPGIYDTQRGFKMFSASAAEKIFPNQKTWRFGFDIELLVIARCQSFMIKEIPVEWNNPEGSTVGLSSYFSTLNELARIFLRKVFGKYNKI